MKKERSERTFRKIIKRYFLFSVLFFVSLLMTILLAFLNGLIFYYRDLNQVLLQAFSQQVESYLEKRQWHMEEFTGIVDATQDFLEDALIQKMIDHVIILDGKFTSLFILNRNGNIRFQWPANPSLIGYDLSSRSFLKNKELSAGFFWSDVFLSPQTGRLAVTIGKKFASGTIHGNVDLSLLEKDIKQQLKDFFSEKGFFLTILDGSGSYISHPDNRLVEQRATDVEFLQQKKRSNKDIFTYWSKSYGLPALVSARPVKNTDCYTLLTRSSTEIFSPFFILVLASMPVIFLIFGGSYLMNRIIDKQLVLSLDLLREQTTRVSQGDYSSSLIKTQFSDLNAILFDFEKMREDVWLREQALRDSEYRFRRMFEDSAIGIMNTTSSGKPVNLNMAMAKMLGFENTSQALEHIKNVQKELWVRPQEHTRILRKLKASPQEKIQITTEFCTRKKEKILDVNIYLSRVFDNWRNEFIFESFVEDITKVKKAEQAIKNMNLKLEKMVQERTNHLEQALDDLKAAQNKLVQSEKMAALGHLISGIAHEVNTPLGAIMASNDNIAVLLKDVFATLPRLFQESTSEQTKLFYQLYKSSNRTLHLDSSLELRKKKKELEDFFQRYQVACDLETIDNLIELGIEKELQNFLPLLKDPSGKTFVKIINEVVSLEKSCLIIEQASDMASKVINALRTFIHQDQETKDKPERIQVAAGLNTVMLLFQNRIKHGIEVIYRIEKVSDILSWPNRLNQVWANLISNAIYAMNYQGILEIEVKQDENFVLVSIIDNGIGIPLEVQDKIFSPFFTTKKAGEGTGLGLDICRRIVEEHNGSITFESQVGHTVFTVKLPVFVTEKNLNQGRA